MILKKEFYFIRHGQTDYNASDQKRDHEDISLNTLGRKQAEGITPIIAMLPVKSIYYSPLKRAIETKQIISTHLSVSHYEIPSLGECSLQVWNDMTTCGLDAYHKGEEHVKSFIQRVQSGMNEALSLEGIPLIVAHGGIHWAICCLMEITNHDWLIDNCVPVHFSPDALGRWSAKKLI